MDAAPSMVQRSGDKLIVRRVVSGEQVHLHESPASGSPTQDDEEASRQYQQQHQQHQQHQQQQLSDSWRREFAESVDESDGDGAPAANSEQEHRQLPQCKIKRNYSCGRCAYFTQNPREYLTHLRDTHGEKIVINECKRCLYASRHYQKLVRHMKMVHGSVDGIRKSAFGSRRRAHGPKAGLLPATLLRSSEAERLTTAYVQHLVAAGLPKLLEEIEKSGAGPQLGTNSFTRNAAIHPGLDMEQLNKSLPYTTPEKQTTREASGTDHDFGGGPGESPQQNDTPEGDTRHSRKRPRPIPNLIPLAVSPTAATPTPSTSRQQRFVKPLPLSALTGSNENENGNGNEPEGGQQFPISLIKHEAAPGEAVELPAGETKCIYCELAFKTVESLANHIKLAHKEDLIAYLLAHSFEEAGPKGRRAGQAGQAGQPGDAWRRGEGHERANEASGVTPAAQPASASGPDDTDEESRDGADGQQHQAQTYCGVETAPGYGEVTSRIPCLDVAGGAAGSTALMKKVFKCPHCSFWASTASRFHVHIVGHLNKKPFECSLCAYRSNWRWDITKHIRLKTIRDPSHKNAGVLMNDETGRRNYTKYNKYVALMQITDK